MAVREFSRFDLGEPMSLHWGYPIAHASDALRAITFFDDVVGEMPRMLTATTWEKVKADLCREVRKLTPRDR